MSSLVHLSRGSSCFWGFTRSPRGRAAARLLPREWLTDSARGGSSARAGNLELSGELSCSLTAAGKQAQALSSLKAHCWLFLWLLVVKNTPQLCALRGAGVVTRPSRHRGPEHSRDGPAELRAGPAGQPPPPISMPLAPSAFLPWVSARDQAGRTQLLAARPVERKTAAATPQARLCPRQHRPQPRQRTSLRLHPRGTQNENDRHMAGTFPTRHPLPHAPGRARGMPQSRDCSPEGGRESRSFPHPPLAQVRGASPSPARQLPPPHPEIGLQAGGLRHLLELDVLQRVQLPERGERHGCAGLSTAALRISRSTDTASLIPAPPFELARRARLLAGGDKGGASGARKPPMVVRPPRRAFFFYFFQIR